MQQPIPSLSSKAMPQVAKAIEPISALPLSSKHRISQISFHPSQPFLAVQCHDRSVEIFRIRTEEEIRKKQARRKKRAKEKQERKGKDDGATEKSTEDPEDAEIGIVDLFTPYAIVRGSGKIRSFDFGPGYTNAKSGMQVCVCRLQVISASHRAVGPGGLVLKRS